jgi:AraC-like DNA-binding protein
MFLRVLKTRGNWHLNEHAAPAALAAASACSERSLTKQIKPNAEVTSTAVLDEYNTAPAITKLASYKM